ncbi:MAG: subclass B1 metallo-beta-lactamase [Sedimentisphaerales bacterium]|nr:subclass B1 metallo-beta-lactamase [Sedimentisphaerales bacterium]
MPKNKILVFLFIVVFLLIFSAQADTAKPHRIRLSEDITITQIDKGAYLVIHRAPYPCNSLLVKLSDKDFLWCDTPCEPAATKTVYEWICKNFGEPNLIEINTGFHEDNLGGNEFLLEKSIPVYGSDATAKIINERGLQEKERILEFYKKGGDTRRYELYKKMTFQPPSRLFEIAKGLTLDIAGEKIEVYFPGPSHTSDNVVVYFHSRKILFGGCMIKALAAKNAGYTEDADMQQWPDSVEKVLQKYGSAEIVVPGHGDYGDISLVKYTIELLRRVNSEKTE